MKYQVGLLEPATNYHCTATSTRLLTSSSWSAIWRKGTPCPTSSFRIREFPHLKFRIW